MVIMPIEERADISGKIGIFVFQFDNWLAIQCG